MANSKVVFNLESIAFTIECSKNETMRTIIQRFGSKIQQNANSFIYLYGGGQVNFDLTFEEQANKLDRENNQMTILVYKTESNGFSCPYCSKKIILGSDLDNILNVYNNFKETINGLKLMLENIIKTSTNDSINSQLQTININLNKIIEDIKKNNEKLEKFFDNNNNSTNNEFENKNIIKGIIEINSSDINKNIVLFNAEIKIGIDVYINDKKINLIKDYNKYQYIFNKTGNYKFEIIFNDTITNCESFFEECSNIISLDLSNFNTSNVDNMSFMFNECHKLKEIIGISKLITNKVTDMNTMFQKCYKLEYLDLTNFNTSNVTNMSFMFNECHKLKEIIGINKFITNNVTEMNVMFNNCKELKYLNLSNFNTTNVTNMSGMFFGCNKLKYLNLSNFSIDCNTNNMLKFNKIECEFIANDKKLIKLYNSS